MYESLVIRYGSMQHLQAQWATNKRTHTSKLRRVKSNLHKETHHNKIFLQKKTSNGKLWVVQLMQFLSLPQITFVTA